MSKVVSLFEALRECKENAPRTSRVVSIRLNSMTYAMLQRVAEEIGDRPSSVAADLLHEALCDCFDAAGWDYESGEAVVALHKSFVPAAPLGLGAGEEE